MGSYSGSRTGGDEGGVLKTVFLPADNVQAKGVFSQCLIQSTDSSVYTGDSRPTPEGVWGRLNKIGKVQVRSAPSPLRPSEVCAASGLEFQQHDHEQDGDGKHGLREVRKGRSKRKTESAKGAEGRYLFLFFGGGGVGAHQNGVVHAPRRGTFLPVPVRVDDRVHERGNVLGDFR